MFLSTNSHQGDNYSWERGLPAVDTLKIFWVLQTKSAEHRVLLEWLTVRLCSHEIFQIIRKPKVRYHFQTNPPPVSIPSQTNPINTLQSCFSKNHFNNILLSRRLSSGLFRYVFPTSAVCNFLLPPLLSSLLRPNIRLSTLFSNTLYSCFFLNMTDQVLHPYKNTGKNIASCILIITFLVSSWEDRRSCVA
jgi:hypothetical protein